eukprot:Ihof_evm4s827 gene=Ihof_evmTU4s827
MLPTFWEFAFHAAAYTHNLIQPMCFLGNIPLQEMWTTLRTPIKQFRTFGSK